MREPVAGRRAAGVVDQHVEAAVGLDRAGDHLGGRVGVHQVDGDVQGAFEVGRGARGDDDVRALREERSGDGEADALGGTGDDGHAAVEFQIHVLTTRAAREV